MDYKNIYLNAFKKNIEEIDADVISEVIKVKERNKDFTAVANGIEKNLREKANHLRSSVQHSFPDLYNRFENRFKEYYSDHLTCYFNYDFPDLEEKYGDLALKECAIELGTLESYSLAANNFPNSKTYLETIYVLNKNYDQYTLNFDPNDSPEKSELFYKMQKERFPGYGEEPGWEEVAIKEIKKKDTEKEDGTEKDRLEKIKVKPGDLFEQAEKLYILHLLHELINQGSEMTTTEFLRILHLTVDVIDTSADLTGNPPNYRRINDGFLKEETPKKKVEVIEGAISKLNRHETPRLKQILKDKLKAVTKK
ncbi:hypothetical protein SAMN04488034_103332 [Salinimicrobium catena]|uniref:Uncharacterized protein n=1 Tax=Salinimicrobium catena TaxID=390640 RepID=A0A1H5N4I8_9FLAO|nr:hypothetical protein [Salinimicrobium catena]SDL36762.1 hypothetical protein SAMN04488140_103332 [Salinimicrobium catena]SEE96515.1 hypothetical protein SAMN04488034_103332 [Salinimicrobium catena]